MARLAARSTIQHAESDLAFRTRLLAEDGIAWILRRTDDGTTLESFDDVAQLPSISGDPELCYRHATSYEPDTIDSVRERVSVTSDAVLLQDDDPWSPYAVGSLQARASSSPRARREVQHHPARVATPEAAQRRATRALESLQMRARVIEGTSTCERLEPAKWFRLTDHPRASLNGEYTLLAVTHERRPSPDGEGDRYHNRFVAIPRGVQIRPEMPRRAPVPRGLQRAVVTSLPGEDVNVDPQGRVTARMGWDLTRPTGVDSSPPLRVAQPLVEDALLTPRVGFEVLVAHERGDLDRPYVTAQLYDAVRRPPYPLPERKVTASLQTATMHQGVGTNELRFDDTAGAEELFLHASQDQQVEVVNDLRCVVGNDRVERVDGHRAVTVEGQRGHRVGAGRTLDVSGEQRVAVRGAMDVRVEGEATDAVTGLRTERVDGAFAEDIGGAFERTVEGNERAVTLREAKLEVAGELKVEVGGTGLTVAGGGLRSEVDGDRTLEVGGLRVVQARQVEQVVGGNLSLRGEDAKVTCRGELREEAGGDLQEKADGARVLRARRITVEALQELTVKAGDCTLTLQASGAVEVKAGTVDLADVKALQQAMHRSN